jgi:hypothetical protein
MNYRSKIARCYQFLDVLLFESLLYVYMLSNVTNTLETVRDELRIVLHKSGKNENNPIGLESASENLEDMN